MANVSLPTVRVDEISRINILQLPKSQQSWIKTQQPPTQRNLKDTAADEAVLFGIIQGNISTMAGKSPVTYIFPKLLGEIQGFYRSQYMEY